MKTRPMLWSRRQEPHVTAPFEPVSFRGGKSAKNRVALAPLTNMQSHADGTLSEEELRWLRMRAEGGFGIVSTCAAHVAKDGQGWPGELGIHDDELLPGLERLAAALRGAGALAFVQLFHGGYRADPAVTGQRSWTASEFPNLPDGPRAASEDDLVRVIRQFAEAAARAHRAGMDGVEVHGAHGYLFTQFLSRVDNRRTDGWGGPLENRARLLREALRAVRASVPPDFVVGVRLSPEDFGNARGLDLDESLTVARWLARDGADFIHLSLWNVGRNTTKRPEVHALTEFRAVVPPEVRLFAAGKIWTRAEAEQVLALGADVVALGRCAIANPDWPILARAGKEPSRPPLTPEELVARGLSPRFVTYMRQWKDFVR